MLIPQSMLLLFCLLDELLGQGVTNPLIFYHSPSQLTGVPNIKIEVLSFGGSYHSKSEAFVFPGISYNSASMSSIRAFDHQGNLIGSTQNLALYSSHIAITSTDKVIIPGLNNGVFLLSIATTPGSSPIFTQIGLYQPDNNFGLYLTLLERPTASSSFYYINTKSATKIYKFDASTYELVISSNRTNQQNPFNFDFIDDTYLLLSSRYNPNFTVVDKTTLAVTVVASPTPCAYMLKFDYDQVKTFYMSEYYATNGYFMLRKGSVGDVLIPDIAYSASLSFNSLVNSILFLPLGYMAISINSPLLYLYRRDPLMQALDPLRIAIQANYQSLVGYHSLGLGVDTKYVFSLIGGGELYYYYYKETYCSNPGEVPCTVCQNDYFLLPDDTCLHRSLIASGFGISEQYILPCEDLKCLSCINNVKVCTVCRTAEFYYVFKDKCILDDLIPDDKGANKDVATGKNGTVVNCLDLNCKNCKKDYSKCDWCHDGYLRQSLTALVCVAESSLPDTQGTDRSANVAVACATQNCRDCKQDFGICTFCLIGFSLNLSQSLICTNNNQIEDFFGPDLVTGKINHCKVSHCLLCKATHLVCDECIARYSLESNTCTRFEDIQDFRGPNLLTKRIDNCAVLNCLKCKEDHTLCSQCDLGYGLSDNKCLRIETLAPGYGLNKDTLFVQFCNDQRCEDCRYDISVCVRCFEEHYFDYNGQCLFYKLIPDRLGPNLNTLRVDRCTTTNCIHCKQNNTNCTRCIEGYELIEQTCHIIVQRIGVHLEDAEVFQARFDSQISVFVSFNDSRLAAKGSFFEMSKQLSERLFRYELRERSSGQLISVRRLRSRISVFNTVDEVYILLQFYIDLKLTGSYYDFRVFNEAVLQFERNGELFGFDPFNSSFEYKNKNPAESVRYYSGLAKNLKILLCDPSSEYSWIYLSSSLKFVLVYLDSSGLFARFLHLSQRIQKLSQLNINYGPKLDTFLTVLNEFEALSSQKVFDKSQIKYLRAYRGKVTNLEPDFFKLTCFKVFLFLFSWFLFMLASVFRVLDAIIPTWMIKVLFWQQKFHQAVFNYLMMDLISFSFRVATSGSAPFQSVLGYICLILASADILRMLDVMWFPWRWVYRLDQIRTEEMIRNLNLRTFVEVEETDIIDKRLQKKRPRYRSKFDAINTDDGKDFYLNRYSTFEKLDSEVYKVRFHEAPVKQLRRIQFSLFVRLHDSVHYLRMIGFQLIVYLAPYATAPGLLSLISLEGIIICYVLFLTIKMKGYLRNCLFLVSELARSAVMGVVLYFIYSMRDRYKGQETDLGSDSWALYCVLGLIGLEVGSLLIQLPLHYCKRRIESDGNIAYDQYIWKKKDNLLETLTPLKINKKIEAKVLPATFLDAKNQFGLRISLKSIEKLKNNLLDKAVRKGSKALDQVPEASFEEEKEKIAELSLLSQTEGREEGEQKEALGGVRVNSLRKKSSSILDKTKDRVEARRDQAGGQPAPRTFVRKVQFDQSAGKPPLS